MSSFSQQAPAPDCPWAANGGMPLLSSANLAACPSLASRGAAECSDAKGHTGVSGTSRRGNVISVESMHPILSGTGIYATDHPSFPRRDLSSFCQPVCWPLHHDSSLGRTNAAAAGFGSPRDTHRFSDSSGITRRRQHPWPKNRSSDSCWNGGSRWSGLIPSSQRDGNGDRDRRAWLCDYELSCR